MRRLGTAALWFNAILSKEWYTLDDTHNTPILSSTLAEQNSSCISLQFTIERAHKDYHVNLRFHSAIRIINFIDNIFILVFNNILFSRV